MLSEYCSRVQNKKKQLSNSPRNKKAKKIESPVEFLKMGVNIIKDFFYRITEKP
jgi:hypothetical protein